MNMGDIYLYTGTGGGKTTNAIGLAVRAVAHNKKVVMIQFLKWWEKTGEYKIRKRLGPNYEIYQFGRKGWKGLKNLGPEDANLCKKGIKFAEHVVKTKKPFLLILDEINLVVHCKLLNVNDVIALLKKIPKRTHVVLTGRFAPKEFYKIADYVNEIVDIKHPKKIRAIAGIQY